jgi:hypothetical protein
MIKRTPELPYAYDLRGKAERDENAWLTSTKLEGIEIGETRGEASGEAKGKLRMLEQILQLEPLSDIELAAMDNTALERMIDLLQVKLRNRG